MEKAWQRRLRSAKCATTRLGAVSDRKLLRSSGVSVCLQLRSTLLPKHVCTDRSLFLDDQSLTSASHDVLIVLSTSPRGATCSGYPAIGMSCQDKTVMCLECRGDSQLQNQLVNWSC